ncbi:hypothetical protein [Nocardia amamiensis]|uniref:hypothetical protein n=1 Tax=Nocardia amamiensis TaxID=404578 RepID=UPI000829FFE5|nr:hypothetical protein [Nocardia amamiensis]
MEESSRAPAADEQAVLRKLLSSNAEIVAEVLDPVEGKPGVSVMAALRAARSLDMVVDDVVHALVRRARSEGHTWAEIGELFGTSRQAAFQRFGGSTAPVAPTPPVPPTPPTPPGLPFPPTPPGPPFGCP